MKECEKVLLYAYGELSAKEQEAFKAHVHTCPSCQKELAFLQKMQEALVPPAAPVSRVEQVFAKTTRKKSFFAGWKPVLAGAAALGLGILMVWGGLYPDKTVLDTREVVAYLSENLDEEYLAFATDLDTFAQEF